jgi:hypothetical protein
MLCVCCLYTARCTLCFQIRACNKIFICSIYNFLSAKYMKAIEGNYFSELIWTIKEEPANKIEEIGT